MQWIKWGLNNVSPFPCVCMFVFFQRSSSSESISDKGSSELKKSFDAVVFDVLKVTPEEYAVSEVLSVFLVWLTCMHACLKMKCSVSTNVMCWLETGGDGMIEEETGSEFGSVIIDVWQCQADTDRFPLVGSAQTFHGTSEQTRVTFLLN